jgi:enamine deaminase RidA (YjgF/YER057c/UK114 family)
MSGDKRKICPEIERCAVLIGQSVPSISLASAHGSWVQVCTTAKNTSLGATDQARQTLRSIEELLVELGSDKQQLLAVKVWIRDMADYPEIVQAWNEWIDARVAPVWSCRRADMAKAEILVEIRVDAARNSRHKPPESSLQRDRP